MPGWKQIILLAVIGLIVSGGIAFFQHSPGYMDADYYYAGGLQLANGKGFTAPYLWNYLDNPSSLPHPSHSYWMPLASMLAALGMQIAGQNTWFAGRIVFLVIAAIIPIITSMLAYSFSKRNDVALISGLLAIFSGFYAAFIPITDTFGVYMLLGGIYFLLAHRQNYWSGFRMGLIAGLMHLARTDGIFWLFISFFVIISNPIHISFKNKYNNKLFMLVICLIGYLLIMSPWYLRNIIVFRALLAPGSETMFWLTDYNQIFSYPPGQITFSTWLENGLDKALSIRLWALNINLQNILASQGSIFLLPLIMIGIWKRKEDRRIHIAILAWLGYIVLMSFVFPFAGARGGFFHSGAVLQPLWWALSPLGLISLVEWVGKKRNWRIEEATKLFLWSSIAIAFLLTGSIITGKLLDPITGRNSWNSENELYKKVDGIINSKSPNNPVVIVANPPGFYLATGRSAIAVPDGDETITLRVAQKFGARYLILEDEGYPDGLKNLYQNPEKFTNFIYLGEVDGTRVFEVNP